MPGLDLVPILLGDGKAQVRRLAAGLERSLGMSIRVRAPEFDADLARDIGRAQYNSSVLLAQLLQMAVPGNRILGVAGVDLFIPILTYVFGEAQVDGAAAVVSLHRLRPELYGLAPDPIRVQRRLLIESVHELGHTFGLLHCVQAGCVMQSSTYVEQIDLKTSEFCDDCRARMEAGRNRMPPAAGA